MDQAEGHVEPASLASGQGRDDPVGDLGQVELRDQPVGPAAGLGAAQPVGPALADQLVTTALLLAGAVALADVADVPADVALVAHHVVPLDLRRCPPSEAMSVVSIRRVVDLPAPLGPRNATSSPRPISRSRPRTASTVAFLRVKWRVSPRVTMAGPGRVLV